jgi:hypothetical protein
MGMAFNMRVIEFWEHLLKSFYSVFEWLCKSRSVVDYIINVFPLFFDWVLFTYNADTFLECVSPNPKLTIELGFRPVFGEKRRSVETKFVS